MPAKYSFSWAERVVKTLKEKYPRATEIVCENLEITERDLAKYLAVGDPLWPDLRNLIHWTDGFKNVWHESCFKDQWNQKVRQLWVSKNKQRFLFRLDELVKCSIIKEQA